MENERRYIEDEETMEKLLILRASLLEAGEQDRLSIKTKQRIKQSLRLVDDLLEIINNQRYESIV